MKDMLFTLIPSKVVRKLSLLWDGFDVKKSFSFKKEI